MNYFSIMVFKFILLWMSAYIFDKCLQHDVKNQFDFAWSWLFIHWKVDFLSTKSFKDLTNLISIVINFTHCVLIEIHDFRLLIYDALNFMNDSMINFLINFNKKISQNIHCSKNIPIFLFIHVFTELIFECKVFSSELIEILLFEILLGIVIINVPFKEFACTLLLVNILNSKENDNEQNMFLYISLSSHKEHFTKLRIKRNEG